MRDPIPFVPGMVQMGWDGQVGMLSHGIPLVILWDSGTAHYISQVPNATNGIGCEPVAISHGIPCVPN